MELNLGLKQAQTLSFKQMQSMEILQMGLQELSERVNSELLENPVLETGENLRQNTAGSPAEQENNKIYSESYSRPSGELTDDMMARLYNIGTRDNQSLFEYIMEQLHGRDISPELLSAGEVLAANLDEHGYLREEPVAVGRGAGIAEDVMSEAFSVIRSLDPPGVGARNLEDCLCLQLGRLDNAEEAIEIVSNHLGALARNSFQTIAKATGYTVEEVGEALRLIRSLNPRPGDEFAVGGAVQYVLPDAAVSVSEGQLRVSYIERAIPQLNVSAYYENMLKKSDDEQVKEYLKERIHRAKWLINSIEQRKSTIVDCIEVICDLQREFFLHISDYLQPMTIYDVADTMGVHPTTVSRAIKDKFIRFEGKLYPLKFFFSRKLDAGVSAHMAKVMLKKIISEENKAKPLSDREIAERMEEMQVYISRRAVSKYRLELGIGSAGSRKIIP